MACFAEMPLSIPEGRNDIIVLFEKNSYVLRTRPFAGGITDIMYRG